VKSFSTAINSVGNIAIPNTTTVTINYGIKAHLVENQEEMAALMLADWLLARLPFIFLSSRTSCFVMFLAWLGLADKQLTVIDRRSQRT
jgi:hypothetical protein